MTKVYVLINANHEGSNFRGIFDTREAADAACKAINEAGRKQAVEMFEDDDPEESKRRGEFYDWWDSVKVLEIEMNRAVDL